jgi:ribosomal-protein-alanine N-acetyltransferase
MNQRPTFSISDFQPSDLDELVALDARLFGADAWSRYDFNMMNRQRRRIFWVAREGARLAGYIGAFPRWRTGYIASIGVDIPYQRQGLGRQLMQGVQQIFFQLGLREVKLHVRVDNAPAVAFYQRLGYAVVKTIPHYYADGAPGLLMRLRLKSGEYLLSGF